MIYVSLYVLYTCIHVLHIELTYVFRQALPFLLKDLIKDEVEFINQTLIQNQATNVKLVVDPTFEIQIVLNAYNDWYNHLRQPMLTTDDIKELATKTWRVQFACKRVFPDKSGDVIACTALVLYIDCV